MITLAYLVVLIPLLAYLLAFSYETILSLLRLSKTYQRRHKYQGYAHATWEITHTLLVFSFTSFFVLFSPLVVELADRAYLPLFATGILFAIRGLLYLYLFYVATDDKPHPVWDALFALSHLALLGALIWSIATVARLVIDVPVTPLTDLVPIVAPPVILVLIISFIPLIRMYWGRRT
ncbi:MAG TPA: hypothetical protein VH144_02265 [Candidatus Saccharimonadales bacterium]|jgi:cytochrome bd-type quinol oxidase subunit 2|nr:hypothetical protein [Candidatus Saccharimonadales bacterium]